MPYTWMPGNPIKKEHTFDKLMSPLKNILPNITPLASGCNQPLKMTFEDQLNILQILSPGDTGLMDRGYQSPKLLDAWQTEEKHFICRIKVSRNKTIIRTHEILSDSIVFYDTDVLLGAQGINQTEKKSGWSVIV